MSSVVSFGDDWRGRGINLLVDGSTHAWWSLTWQTQLEAIVVAVSGRNVEWKLKGNLLRCEY